MKEEQLLAVKVCALLSSASTQSHRPPLLDPTALLQDNINKIVHNCIGILSNENRIRVAHGLQVRPAALRSSPPPPPQLTRSVPTPLRADADVLHPLHWPEKAAGL